MDVLLRYNQHLLLLCIDVLLRYNHLRIYEHLQVSLIAGVASGGLGVLFYNSNLNTVHL
jgi:hypothetical protein